MLWPEDHTLRTTAPRDRAQEGVRAGPGDTERREPVPLLATNSLMTMMKSSTFPELWFPDVTMTVITAMTVFRRKQQIQCVVKEMTFKKFIFMVISGG